MTQTNQFQARGVMPACLTPFNEDLSVDERGYRRHLEDVASVEGVAAICANGHAGEVSSLTFDEQRRVVAVTKEVLGSRVPTVIGVFTNSSMEAARLARMAQDEGADALLVFPPDILGLEGTMRPASIVEHFRWITEASDLPIIAFQYPLASRLAYPLETLLDLCHRYPQIRAIKDQYGDGKMHERHIRELAALDRPVNVLTTHSTWLLGSLALGCQGILSGAGSVIANLQVALFRAVSEGRLEHAREINDRIFPTVRAFYDSPLFDQHNRMKEALVYLGRMERAVVRPPLVKLTDPEIAKICEMMTLAGLNSETAYAKVA
ncbi:dihydrodipicolinate synthase family protein [Jiella sonneratiae]|uniref:Dihydrodipicolinate synthase family protein n=1 Tax=Jiella sonneratiae TaxID=2816856 RepID=A0ABS3J3I9_9HYPH|nr:dihydrodipicolinate synthase family protein [Jiella sonneratiae]MBO0904230.1 dihydrodipicolinate synthase family protein [Jiella sonneratiae]